MPYQDKQADPLYCNQRRLGPPLFAALYDLMNQPDTPPEIKTFLDQGSVGVENQSCAIASMATAINLALNKPVMTLVTTPKIIRELLHYHNQVKVMNTDGEKGWQVFNDVGFRYHAMAVVALACGVDARVIWYPLPSGKPPLPFEQFLRQIGDGSVASISVRNQFAQDVTGGKYNVTLPFGHIVTISQVLETSSADPKDWMIAVSDPVADVLAPPTMHVRAGTLLEYSMARSETVRGLIYDSQPQALEQFEAYRPPNIHYPQEVITPLRQFIKQLDVL